MFRFWQRWFGSSTSEDDKSSSQQKTTDSTKPVPSKEEEKKPEPPAEKKPEPEPEVTETSDLAAQLSAELAAGTETKSDDMPVFISVENVAKYVPPTETADEARKIQEQHEVNRAAQQLLESLNPNNILDEDSASSSSSVSSSSSSSSSSSAASSAPGSPKPAALDVADLDDLLKGVSTSDDAVTTDSSTADLMAALNSIGSIPGEKPATPTETKNDTDDLMAALDSLGGDKQPESKGTDAVDDLAALASLDLPDLSALDGLGGASTDAGKADLSTLNDLGDLGDLGDLSSLNQLTTDLSALDALAGLDGLAEKASEKPAERPLVLDHYEAEDTNVAGLRRGKKKPTLTARGVAKFQMEDAHVAVFPFNHSTTQAFFGVFDGFSGRDCAQDATHAVPKALADNIAAAGGLSADLTAIWPKVFADADEALRAHEYVGCTCTSVFVWEFEGERYVQSANCGDSNVYLFRGDKAIMLNTEHKVTSAEERKRIQAMGIEMTPGQTRVNGVAVARALGVHFIKDEGLGIVSTPSISTVYKIQPDDHFLVIASDGLWDVISGQNACEMIRDLPSASAMASTLLKHAVKSSKCVDNVTVVVIRL